MSNVVLGIRKSMKAKMQGISEAADWRIVEHVDVVKYNGSPNGALTGRLGMLCWDYTNSDIYFNTNAGTAWTKVVD